MRTPVTLITGVGPEAMATTMVSLLFDLPHAVAVRHHIDVGGQVLVRTVSDAAGIIEHEELNLEHACVSCAIREDVIPTLDRVARDGRWTSILAHLPVGAPAEQICTVSSLDRQLARTLRVSSVVTALRGPSIVADLLGDALLRERGLESSDEDSRGVGEVAAAMVEYADVIVVQGDATETGVDLVRTLARADAKVVESVEQLTAQRLAGALHDHARSRAWTDPLRTGALPQRPHSGVWTLDLRSHAAFHPERLLTDLESLGGGHHRSRGCFWLPTRPEQSLVWDGAGGQLSIGNGQPWGRRTPMTRIVITGVGSPLGHLEAAFERLLMSPTDASKKHAWQVYSDGFEAWLGPVRDDAA